MCGKKQPSQTSTTPSQSSSNKTGILIPYEEREMKYDFDYDAIIESVIETEKECPRDNITQGKTEIDWDWEDEWIRNYIVARSQGEKK